MNLFKKENKKQNLFEEIREITNNKLIFDLEKEPVSGDKIIKRKEIVSNFLNKHIAKKDMDKVYIPLFVLSGLFAISTFVGIFVNDGFLLSILFLIFSFISVFLLKKYMLRLNLQKILINYLLKKKNWKFYQ